MSSWAQVAVVGVAGGYALVSRRLSTTVVSGPMVFVTAGLALGPLGLGLFSLSEDAGSIRLLFEAALVLVLFNDALTIQSTALRRGEFLPIRLLTVGLPLTIALGWLAAWLLWPRTEIWELAVLGVILAPTDAALGLPAISDPRVPALVRQGLNVESGLNDGMSLPFFVLFLAAVPGTAESAHGIFGVFARALVLSAGLGAAVGWFGAKALRWSASRRWVDHQWRPVLVLAAAAAAYSLAVIIDGSGFIAAWAAGLAFGMELRGDPPTAAQDRTRAAEKGTRGEKGESRTSEQDLGRTTGFSEDLGSLLASLSFLAFGAVLLGPVLKHLDWRSVVYAVLSLTVVRLVPVALSLIGSGLRRPTVAYVGWFGPRGLATIVLALIVLEEHTPGVDVVTSAAAVAVGLSVYAHGATSVPFATRYGAWWSRAAASPGGQRLRESGSAEQRNGLPRLGADATSSRGGE